MQQLDLARTLHHLAVTGDVDQARGDPLGGQNEIDEPRGDGAVRHTGKARVPRFLNDRHATHGLYGAEAGRAVLARAGKDDAVRVRTAILG